MSSLGPEKPKANDLIMGFQSKWPIQSQNKKAANRDLDVFGLFRRAQGCDPLEVTDDAQTLAAPLGA